MNFPVNQTSQIFNRLEHCCFAVVPQVEDPYIGVSDSICEILRPIQNLRDPPELRMLAKQIVGDDRILGAVFSAILGRSEYTGLRDALICDLVCDLDCILDELENALALKDSLITRNDFKKNLIKWKKKYAPLFTEKNFHLLSPHQSFHFTGLIARLSSEIGEAFTTSSFLNQEILRIFSEEAWSFETWQQLKSQCGEDLKIFYLITSHFISHKNVKIWEIKNVLPIDDFEKLLEVLTYGNFLLPDYSDEEDKLWSAQVPELLKKAKNLKGVEIFLNYVQELPDLPKCLYLNCEECLSLKKIGELPECEVLKANDCIKLEELPNVLPKCQDLNCSKTALERLPEAPLLKQLFCWGCPRLQMTAKTYPNCIVFECMNCPFLEEIPELPKVFHFNCKKCSNLRKFPAALPECIYFISSYCKLVKNLPELPQANSVICKGCESLEEILELPNCSELNLHGSKKLAKLPSELSKCEILNCSETSLVSLSEAPRLEELICWDCPELKAMAGIYPNCLTFNCRFCAKLVKLPELPNATRVECKDCDSVRIFPQVLQNCVAFISSRCPLAEKLPQLPKAKIVKCKQWPSLKELLELPYCEILDCYGCTNLQFLPTRLPACRELHCEECPRLRFLSDVPINCNIYSKGLNFNSLYVETSELANNPREFLLRLGSSFLLKNKPFPNVIYTEKGLELLGVDNGGLRRDFMSRLCRNLFSSDKVNPNHLYLGVTNFPEMKRLEDSKEVSSDKINSNHLYLTVSIFPEMKILVDSEEVKLYRTLGCYMALCYHQSSYFKMGPFFEEKVYRLIQQFKETEFPSMKVWVLAYLQLIDASSTLIAALKEENAALLTDRDWITIGFICDEAKGFSKEELEQNLDLSLNASIQSSTWDDLKNFFPNDDALEELLEFYERESLLKQERAPKTPLMKKSEKRYKLGEILMDKAIHSPALNAVRCIASGMSQVLFGCGWAEMLEDPEIMLRVQGELSKESLIQKFCWNRGRGVSEADHHKTKSYLVNWVNSASPTQLSLFLGVVTGNRAMGQDTQLNLETYNRGNSFPTARTCFYRLELSAQYTDQTFFNQQMDVFLLNAIDKFDFH